MEKQSEYTTKLSVIDKLQGYAVRTFIQLYIHIAISIFIATIIGVCLPNKYVIKTSDFVVIISSLSAASGVLLAVTLSLATFYSRHIEDWRERLVQKLVEDRERVAKQMKESATLHPEISNRLAELYLKSTLYIPGQAIDTSQIYKADKIFSDWAQEQAGKNPKKFNFGDLGTYNYFGKHLFDALISSTELRHTLIDLSIVERAGRSIVTFSPLIVTWLTLTIFTVVVAIIGAMSLVPVEMNIAILVIPLYLFLIAIFALTKDITAILSHMRIKETGTAQAMSELISKWGA